MRSPAGGGGGVDVLALPSEADNGPDELETVGGNGSRPKLDLHVKGAGRAGAWERRGETPVAIAALHPIHSERRASSARQSCQSCPVRFSARQTALAG